MRLVHRRSSTRLPTALVAALLLLAGCAELERPPAYSPVTTVELAAAQPDEKVQPAPVPQADDGGKEFVPSTSLGYLASLLVVTDEGLREVGEKASVPVSGLEEFSPVAAYDDLVGGLVIEDSQQGVVYLPSQGNAEVVMQDDVHLLDVGYWDGSPRAFVQRPDGSIDRVQLVAEQASDEREQVTHVRLEPGEQVVDFSASRGIQALIVQNDTCGDLRFYGTDGERLDIGPSTVPECTLPGRPVFGSVAISPDGEAVAYTTVAYRSDGTEAGTSLEVRELTASEAFLPFRIGEDLDRITSLAFDGGRVAYRKESADGASVVVIDITDQVPRPLLLLSGEPTGSVAFARNPILLQE